MRILPRAGFSLRGQDNLASLGGVAESIIGRHTLPVYDYAPFPWLELLNAVRDAIAREARSASTYNDLHDRRA